MDNKEQLIIDLDRCIKAFEATLNYIIEYDDIKGLLELNLCSKHPRNDYTFGGACAWMNKYSDSSHAFYTLYSMYHDTSYIVCINDYEDLYDCIDNAQELEQSMVELAKEITTERIVKLKELLENLYTLDASHFKSLLD